MDASVFVKWASEEEYAEEAYALRDAYISKKLVIAVPSIFGYEVLNAIRYSKYSTPEKLDRVAEALDNYGFLVFDLQGDLSKLTAKVSAKYQIGIYDSSYVALAIISGSTFYTADKGIIDAVKLPNIKHIKSFR